MKSSFKPTVMLIASRAASFLITFFIPVVLVRVFDQATFGAYKQVFLLYAVLYPIAQIGMAESLYYFLPGHPETNGKTIFNSVVMLALSGLVCLTALAAYARPIARWLGNPEAAVYMVPIGVFLWLMLITSVLEISMIARKQYQWASFTYVFSDLARSLCLVASAILFKHLWWVLASAIVFGCARLLYTLWYLRREFDGSLELDWAQLRRQFSYVLPFEAAIVAEILQTNYHQYSVSHHFGVVAFAIYSVGCLQLPFVDIVANPACNVMMVRLAEEMGNGRHVLAIWQDTTRKLALIFVPLFALLVISSREIILLLFTQRYAAAIPIFVLWAGVVPLAVFQTDGLLRSFAQTRFILYMNLLRLGIVAVFIGTAMSIFGLQGAVLITLLATAIAKGVTIVRAARLMCVSVAQILPWQSLAAICAATAVASVPTWIVKTELHFPGILQLMLMGVVFAASYGAVVWGFGILSREERESCVELLELRVLANGR